MKVCWWHIVNWITRVENIVFHSPLYPHLGFLPTHKRPAQRNIFIKKYHEADKWSWTILLSNYGKTFWNMAMLLHQQCYHEMQKDAAAVVLNIWMQIIKRKNQLDNFVFMFLTPLWEIKTFNCACGRMTPKPLLFIQIVSCNKGRKWKKAQTTFHPSIYLGREKLSGFWVSSSNTHKHTHPIHPPNPVNVFITCSVTEGIWRWDVYIRLVKLASGAERWMVVYQNENFLINTLIRPCFIVV